MLPEWVEITITVPKLTGTELGALWWTAERVNEKERVSKWRKYNKAVIYYYHYYIIVTVSITTASI